MDRDYNRFLIVKEFLFSYLGIESKRYHPVAGVCHGLILILLWSTNYIVTETFATRDFIGLESPYFEPALGPLGPVFVLYGTIASVNATIVWIKHKMPDPKHWITYMAGMGFWILLGIHDGLASLGAPYALIFHGIRIPGVCHSRSLGRIQQLLGNSGGRKI
ncbi:MAG: hypothetical protein SV375_00345 [Thermodesulfobacteriota bacterium]|nr:hypothetical protein [Thermodesulfobacteriota bacterium]